MNKHSPFPWHYYVRAIRSRFFFIILACVLTYVAYSLYPETFLGKEVAILAFLFILVSIQTYFRIAPIRHVLARLEAVQEELPYGKRLDLIYQKDEFELIDQVLGLAESQLKQQRESYENQVIQSDTILEYIPNAVVIIDRFKNCKQYNGQFKEKFINNYASEKSSQNVELPLGMPKLWKIFSQDDLSDLLDSFDQVLFSKKPTNLYGKNFPEIHKYFDIAITPIFDNKNEVTGALGIFHNVTQSKLNDKMRVDFVANVSHEVRTPLTSIKGYAQLLHAQQNKLPEQAREITAPVLEKINSNTERLKELFDNLLKLSLIESKSDINKEEFGINQLIQQIGSRLKGKYLHQKFEVSTGEEAFICGDKKLLDQVFTNLIDNAIKYSDKELCQIKVGVNKSKQNFEISVSDNGPGISYDEQERIFERFYRIQGASDRAIEGSGLGLSIVKHILNKHNASIKATSYRGEGSTFTICLPIIPEC